VSPARASRHLGVYSEAIAVVRPIRRGETTSPARREGRNAAMLRTRRRAHLLRPRWPPQAAARCLALSGHGAFYSASPGRRGPARHDRGHWRANRGPIRSAPRLTCRCPVGASPPPCDNCMAHVSSRTDNRACITHAHVPLAERAAQVGHQRALEWRAEPVCSGLPAATRQRSQRITLPPARRPPRARLVGSKV